MVRSFTASGFLGSETCDFQMWGVSAFVVSIFVGIEIALFFSNKALGTPTGISATNVEVAFVTVLGWWYNALSQDSIFIKQLQDRVVELGKELRERERISTIDTSHKVRLVYFCSRTKMI